MQLHAVYMDHGLRPAETPKEKLFVEALCKAYDIPFHLFEIPRGLVEALKPSVRERRSSKVSTMESAKARRSSPQELLREWRISTAARLARTLLESGEDGESEARESGTALKTFLSRAFVCLAHHGDDVVETFFLKFLRGTHLTNLGSASTTDRQRHL